jgi:hypothetical protein
MPELLYEGLTIVGIEGNEPENYHRSYRKCQDCVNWYKGSKGSGCLLVGDGLLSKQNAATCRWYDVEQEF